MQTKNSDRISFPMRIRMGGALAGIFSGGMLGTICSVVFIVITDVTFGLRTIWPGTLLGVILGACLGFLFPKKAERLIELLS